MGKHPGASQEELEFIFGCFLRGLENKEVLDEMEDTEFPKRNPRFIRDRRIHFDAAKKVLERQGFEQLRKSPTISTSSVPIVIPKRKIKSQTIERKIVDGKIEDTHRIELDQ